MKKLSVPAGMEDVLPEKVKKWHFIEDTVQNLFNKYGFLEIRTPCLENTVLFIRGIGENTDIVEKEMYTFGSEESSVSLRPEGTAPVIRLYIEQGYDKFSSFQKYWYMGPMFRHERPQKGRKRQFFQAGIEILGTYLPSADVDCIILGQRFLQSLRVKKFDLKINSTGCRTCKETYRTVLKESLKDRLEILCQDCRRRYETNIFRVLDCKIESCRAVFDDVPDMLESLCSECKDHHEQVKQYLFDMKIEFDEDRFLVRGLDYYTKTVFEFTHPSLGAQNAVLGGGRYDGLVEDMGGKPQGAVGFAAGLDRILEVSEGPIEEEIREGVFLATVGESAYKKGFSLIQEFRDNGVRSDIDFENRSLKAQLKMADRRNFRIAAILGDEELDQGVIKFRDLETGMQTELDLENIKGNVSKLIKDIDEELKREVSDGNVR